MWKCEAGGPEVGVEALPYVAYVTPKEIVLKERLPIRL